MIEKLDLPKHYGRLNVKCEKKEKRKRKI